ncbi:MAG: hypothetical protein WD055_04385 [Candidatus Dependentiae bacterium]
MKSIVQEASSVVKAIDCAWKRAEQPAEFSVRIHEHPKKNMFGFTTKSAKIALFYGEEKPRSRNSKPTARPLRQKKTAEASKPTPAPEKSKAPVAARTRKIESTDPWNEEMVAYAQKWLEDLLNALQIKHAQFNVEPQRYHLKVTFTKPVFPEDEKNRTLFRNCAHLMLQSARNNFKRPLKGFKVVLTTGS